MDMNALKKGILNRIGSYKYVLLVLVIGMVLMMLPGKDTDAGKMTDITTQDENLQQDLTKELTDILMNIQGAGKVQVMLTLAQGEEILYQTDSTTSTDAENSHTKTQTILVTDSERRESGLVRQRIPPVYLGAIVLSQGAEDPVVKLAIMDAVSKATGLRSDKISVLKMR